MYEPSDVIALLAAALVFLLLFGLGAWLLAHPRRRPPRRLLP